MSRTGIGIPSSHRKTHPTFPDDSLILSYNFMLLRIAWGMPLDSQDGGFDFERSRSLKPHGSNAQCGVKIYGNRPRSRLASRTRLTPRQSADSRIEMLFFRWEARIWV